MIQEASTMAFSATSVQDPSNWNKTWDELRSKAVRSRDQVVLTHDAASPLNFNSFKVRLICSVRTLPRLNDVKSALRRMVALRERCNGSIPYEFPLTDTFRYDDARGFQAPIPTIWAVETSLRNDITVTDAINGVMLMRISALKSNVMVSSMLHAPFRGLIDRSLDIIPIEQPLDLLQVRETAVVVTDYVWVGFADGAIRLFPADSQRVREQDRSVLLARGDIADLVYELPKNHNAAIVAISRSPCHEDGKTTDLVTANRLSSAIRELTAATSSHSNKAREHLSLVCTASEDSCIVVWDLQKIYRRLEEMRVSPLHANKKSFGVEPTSRVHVGSVVTFELMNPRVVVRSSCTMVKVRPLFKLKGSVSGLRTLNWVTTNVTTVNYQKPRDVVAMTRDPKNFSTQLCVRNRRALQHSTQWERREEHRLMLRLTESEMREVERELELLMPPLAAEPPQSRRINLIIAGDANGVVHIWDLDEELRRKMDFGDMHLASLDGVSLRGSTARPSPARSSARNESQSRDTRSVFSPCRSPPKNHDSQSRQAQLRSESPRFQRYDEYQEQQHRQKEKRNKLLARAQRERNVLQTTRVPKSPRRWMSASATSANVARRVRPSKKCLSASLSMHTPLKTTSWMRQSTLATPHSTYSSRRAVPNLLSNLRAETPTMGTIPSSRIHTASRRTVQLVPDKRFGIILNKFAADASTNTTVSETASMAAPETPAHPHRQRSSRRTLVDLFPHDSAYRAAQCFAQIASPHVSKRTPQRSSPLISHKNLRLTSPRNVQKTPLKSPLCVSQRTSQRDSQKPSQRVKEFAIPPSTDEMCTVPWCSSRDARMSVSPPRSVSARMSTNGSPARARGDWLAGHAEANDLYCRDAKCRMELTDGGSVTGIAVDLPPTITVTMRRVPDPPESSYSLLEEMPEEEVCLRQLANTFYDLTDDRALFCAFERLRFYLSVEGTVMSIQCVPKVLAPAKRGADSRIIPSYRVGSAREQIPDDTAPLSLLLSPSYSSFSVVFRRHVLERHSQPISKVFVDHPRHQLWVARHDGLFSVFSTLTGAVITRLPHPSAPAALGPPGAMEWRRQQRDMALREGRPLHLEVHRECRGFPPAHFIDAMPITVMQQFALLRSSVNAVAEPGTDNDVELVKMDGRTAFDTRGRGREASLAQLLQALKFYRKGSVAVCEAQRDRYHALCSLLADRVRIIIGHCASLTLLHAARRAFRAWRVHCEHFSREFVLRRMREHRLKKVAGAARMASTALFTSLMRVYYDRWGAFARMLRIGRCEIRLAQVFGINKRPDICERVVNVLADCKRRRRFWILWRSLINSTPAPGRAIVTPRMYSPRAASGSLSPRRLNTGSLFDTRSPRSLRASYSASSRPRGEYRDNVFADLNAIICCIHGYRHNLIRFRFDENTDSVLDIDDLWIDTIETAAAEADSKTPYAYKLAVFKFSLLPLLDGLVSTAEEVLPHILNSDVSDEIRSLIRACLQSIDHLYADSESIVGVMQNVDQVYLFPSHGVVHRKQESARVLRDREMRALFEETMDDSGFRMQIECITAQRPVIDEFLRVCCS